MIFRRITSSAAILSAASAVFVSGLCAAVFPVSEYMLTSSASVIENFYLLGLVMMLVVLASASLGFLVIRLIWGPNIDASFREDDAEIDEVAKMRGMRATGTKKAAVLIFALIAVSVLADRLGGGVLLTDTRAVRVLTLLRSPEGQDRADAVHDAVMLAGDKRVQDSLKHILTTKGEAREWAAYAAGVRNDTELSDALVGLLRFGTDRERAAAAVALARMGDEQLIEFGRDAYARMASLKNDVLKAFGMLGRRKSMLDSSLEKAGQFLTDIIKSPDSDTKTKQLAIWAAGNFNAPEALLPIEEMLHSGTDTALMCIGLEALGKIGSASTAPKLVEALYTFDKKAQCPEVVYADFTRHEVLICTRINIIERLLHEIAHIGDRSVKKDVLKVSKDPSFSPAAQALAAEIAFQMKYKPVEPPLK
jgi:hypothetical protein